MQKINIIGIGPGNTACMTAEAVRAIERSAYLIGDKRMLAAFAQSQKTLLHSSNAKEIKTFVQGLGPDAEVSILVSGDVGFYSLAKSLTSGGDHGLDTGAVNLICGISSLQYLCAKIRTAWDDVVSVSLHGRKTAIVGKVLQNPKVFVLTDATNTPAAICRLLCEHGLGHCLVSVGENLSYDSERISSDRAENLIDRSFEALCVMLITNDKPLAAAIVTHGLPDELFIRGSAPMTKHEIRTVSLAKLQLQLTDTVYDVGAGTGSVAIECALQARAGEVYAIEKDPEAVELLKRNREKFGAMNLNIVQACAPEGLEGLPKPDKVFVGGSGGSLEAVLDCVFTQNPAVRVVINAITLETLHAAVSYFKPKPWIETDIVQIMAARARQISDYNLMTGLNPVYIITAQRGMPS